MKTTLVPTASWPNNKPDNKRDRMPRPKVYAKTQPITEVDYLREAHEQLAEIKRKKEQK